MASDFSIPAGTLRKLPSRHFTKSTNALSITKNITIEQVDSMPITNRFYNSNPSQVKMGKSVVLYNDTFQDDVANPDWAGGPLSALHVPVFVFTNRAQPSMLKSCSELGTYVGKIVHLRFKMGRDGNWSITLTEMQVPDIRLVQPTPPPSAFRNAVTSVVTPGFTVDRRRTEPITRPSLIGSKVLREQCYLTARSCCEADRSTASQAILSLDASGLDLSHQQHLRQTLRSADQPRLCSSSRASAE